MYKINVSGICHNLLENWFYNKGNSVSLRIPDHLPVIKELNNHYL